MKSNLIETKKNEVEVLYSAENAMKEKVDLLKAIIGGNDIESCSVGTFSESTFVQHSDDGGLNP